MLAVLLLNRMHNKKRLARKQKLSKPAKVDAQAPVVNFCRTCLSTEDLESIFPNKELEKKRSQELELVTGLEIRMNDGLSQKICGKCIEVMNSALLFRRTSIKSEKTLLAMGGRKKRKHKQRKKVPKTNKLKSTQDDDNDFSYDMDVGFQNDDYGDDNGYQDIEYRSTEYKKPIESQDETQLKNVPSVKPRPKRSPLTGPPPYKCGTCGKEFRMKATYKAHMRFHTNYCVCETCGKRCRNNNQLQEHKRARHGLGRIHKCAYCEYSSATKEALTIHERRHTGERPYVCDHCAATFHRRSNLVQHIAIHLPEKNFQCLKCNKREKSKKLLLVHDYKVHRERRHKYLCPVCRDVFTRPGNVRHHLQRSHGVRREDQGPIERQEFQVHTSVLPENIMARQPLHDLSKI